MKRALKIISFQIKANLYSPLSIEVSVSFNPKRIWIKKNRGFVFREILVNMTEETIENYHHALRMITHHTEMAHFYSEVASQVRSEIESSLSPGVPIEANPEPEIEVTIEVSL